MTSTTTTKNPGMVRRRGTHKMVCMAAAAAFSTSVTTTHAWVLTDVGSSSHRQNRAHHSAFGHCDRQQRNYGSVVSPFSLATPPISKATNIHTTATTRLYSSSRFRKRRSNTYGGGDDDEDNNGQKELFGFRRAAKRAARRVLPTKWFGTKKEKEALERKQEVRNRVKGELDQMLKGAPLPIQILGKYVAGPMMGKIASKVAEATVKQQEAMEEILDEARSYLINDPSVSGLLGTPIQIGTPFSQVSGATVINGKRQMRTEFAVEVSGPRGNGMSRIVATNEGIGQLLVESSGKVYNVDLSSKGRMSSSSRSSPRASPRSPKSTGSNRSAFDDDNIIEAEIIDKETK
eukprot:CAMPEP_0201122434 /NCGR_PEP_ID=MMETSP0850-20130426/6092_1 /ASSEMBLY_ACC=CAM_ASM_000622 /TAXON_ID=183588 /ORGANISM="Pseudo-nitzschia fraudulenta, Strain WWA7" /LENGTH=346 /DNA_ID=CAMNT_0047389137 /DNA_START=142 /DNA_END=1182 /DNA_ORIENTATION=+